MRAFTSVCYANSFKFINCITHTLPYVNFRCGISANRLSPFPVSIGAPNETCPGGRAVSLPVRDTDGNACCSNGLGLLILLAPYYYSGREARRLIVHCRRLTLDTHPI